jgi:hypothetical protein
MAAEYLSVHTFLSHVDIADGCWEWTARIHKLGYGVAKIKMKSQYAHRVSYRIFKGEIPGNLEIDHLCRKRSCVNLDHLEAVTHAENMRRMREHRLAHPVTS